MLAAADAVVAAAADNDSGAPPLDAAETADPCTPPASLPGCAPVQQKEWQQQLLTRLSGSSC